MGLLRLLSRRRYVLSFLLSFAIFFAFLQLYLWTIKMQPTSDLGFSNVLSPDNKKQPQTLLDLLQKGIIHNADKQSSSLNFTARHKSQGNHRNVKDSSSLENNARKVKTTKQLAENLLDTPDYNVHVFYYMWYGNPEHDKVYLHWNHKIIPDWHVPPMNTSSKKNHVPPLDIASNFYPELGPYSSQSADVMRNHMEQIRESGAGVLAVSWYPPGKADENGQPWDQYIPKLMDIAHEFQLKVCFHIEPYGGRDTYNIHQWINYIHDTYGEHAAYYRREWKHQLLPIYYIYDSYRIPSSSWKQLLQRRGSHTIRRSASNGIFIGLVVDYDHITDLTQAGFDGYYTYFASNGMSYGSTTGHWKYLADYAVRNDMMFIPSVGPGYIDLEVRPWNMRTTRNRENGKYLRHMFAAAIGAEVEMVSVTSFNEWHEGTQIERAVSFTRNLKVPYFDYSPNDSEFYLNVTRHMIAEFQLANANRQHISM